jgi:hypothetical protein
MNEVTILWYNPGYAIMQSVLLTLYKCTQLPVMCNKLALGLIIQTHLTLSVAT